MRLPLQPLIDYVGEVWTIIPAADVQDPRARGARFQSCETQALAELLGRSRRTVDRLRHTGLDVYEADRIAQRVFGVHPDAIWGDAWWGDEFRALAPEVEFESEGRFAGRRWWATA